MKFTKHALVLAAVLAAAKVAPFAFATDYANGPGTNDNHPPFTFQSLLNLISANHVSSIDELVPVLPDSYKKSFVLMLDSGSLQSASPASPRVISFGSADASEERSLGHNPDRLYIAFQSDTRPRPGSKLPESLEVIEWSPEQKNYQFYQVDFPITATSIVKNPTTCNGCHGTPLRPNWTAYPRWDGAFGNHMALTGKYAGYTSDQEILSYVANLQSGNSRLQPLDFSAYTSGGHLGVDYPLLHLSSKIGDQLAVRDVDVIRHDQEFSKLRYAFAGMLLRCTNVADFFEPAVFGELQAGIYENLSYVPHPNPSLDPASPRDLSYERLWQMTSLLVERDQRFGGFAKEVSLTTWLRFLFEGRGRSDFLANLLGTPPATADTPSWNDGFVGAGDRLVGLQNYYLAHQFGDFADVPELYSASDAEDGWQNKQSDGVFLPGNGPADQTCAELAQKSRAIAAGFSARPVPRPATVSAGAADPLLAKFHAYCASCHTSGNRPLPLNDLGLLRSYRGAESGATVEEMLRLSMPPAGAPQPGESERLEMLGAVQ